MLHKVENLELFYIVVWDPAVPPIAAGSYGDVYAASLIRDNEQRKCALKVIPLVKAQYVSISYLW